MSESQTNAGNQPSCQVVVRLSSLIPWDLGHAEKLLFSCLWSKVTYPNDSNMKCQHDKRSFLNGGQEDLSPTPLPTSSQFI